MDGHMEHSHEFSEEMRRKFEQDTAETQGRLAELFSSGEMGEASKFFNPKITRGGEK